MSAVGRGSVDVVGVPLLNFNTRVYPIGNVYAPKLYYGGTTIIDAADHAGHRWRIHAVSYNPKADAEMVWSVEFHDGVSNIIYNEMEHFIVPAKSIVCKDFHSNYIELPEGADLTLYSSLGAAADFFCDVYYSIES